MSKKKWMIPAITGCVLLTTTCGLMYGLPAFVMKGKRQTLEEAFAWQSDHYDTSFYQGLEKRNYEIAGEDGYLLHVELLKNPEPTTKYVILTHGHTDNRMGTLKYVPIYMRQGFHCIIYDIRGHGENQPAITTYGTLEGKDLYCLIRDTQERYPELTVLGLHGESLGSAATISSLKYHPQVDFVVADCGFADIENVLRGIVKKKHMPVFFVDLADLGARIRYGYALKKMRPIESLEENTVPILFIHGEEDRFIRPENSERMAKTTKGKKKLVLVPEARHAESVLVDPVTYEEIVDHFLAECRVGKAF